MTSGAKAADGVKELYQQMKVVKHDDDQNERIRIVVFSIVNNFIDVEKIYREKDLCDKDVYKFFLSVMVSDQCRYVLYDCHFETRESSRKEELVFVLWAPEGSCIKDKMLYASSKRAIKDIVKGAKHDLQINDIADFQDRDYFADQIGRSIIKIEGQPVKSLSTVSQ